MDLPQTIAAFNSIDSSQKTPMVSINFCDRGYLTDSSRYTMEYGDIVIETQDRDDYVAYTDIACFSQAVVDVLYRYSQPDIEHFGQLVKFDQSILDYWIETVAESLHIDVFFYIYICMPPINEANRVVISA